MNAHSYCQPHPGLVPSQANVVGPQRSSSESFHFVKSMTHICNGRLCDIYRARILRLTLSESQKTSGALPSRRKHAAPCKNAVRTRGDHQNKSIDMDSSSQEARTDDDILNLVTMLADSTISRSVKEQLHNMLLSNAQNKAKLVEKASRSIGRKFSTNHTSPEPGSHFSDSSDDEVLEGSDNSTKDSRSISVRGRGPGHRRNDRSIPYQLCSSKARKGGDQDLFDLEI